jgi:hypothetical protein
MNSESEMRREEAKKSEQERVVARMEKLAKRLRKSLWRASGRPPRFEARLGRETRVRDSPERVPGRAFRVLQTRPCAFRNTVMATVTAVRCEAVKR